MTKIVKLVILNETSENYKKDSLSSSFTAILTTL